MNRSVVIGVLACFLLSACGGGTPTTPSLAPVPASTSTFTLNPSPVELSSDAPAAIVTAQGDVAGVQYTPHADPSCVIGGGSIAVAGDGVAQLDVAGAPLMFIVVATGTPAGCMMTVTGSDGSSATVPITYTTITLTTDVMNRAHVRGVAASVGTFTPSSVTISDPTDVVMVNAAGFNGLTKSSVSCSGTKTGIGVSVIPSSFNGSGQIAIAPYGQGALSGTCTVAFTDSTSVKTTLAVTLTAAALSKLTVTPSNVQFSCAGSLPQTCTTPTVTIAESGATEFKVNNHPTLANSCANVFNGPLMMTTGNGAYAPYIAGPQATVSFYGLLPSSSLGCKKIIIGDGGAQTVVVSVNQQLASGGTAATAPSCTGPDPHAADPNAPHGLYIWNPYREGNVESQIQQYVLGTGTTPLDPDICGASIVVPWSDVEPNKGSYYWKDIDGWVAPYVKVGLRVNLLFEDASEEYSSDPTKEPYATPTWVYTVDNVGQINCPELPPSPPQPPQPPYPNWLDPTFQKDYKAFIDAVVAHFSTGGAAKYAANIGYLRFGIGAGVEAYPGHIESPGTNPAPCLAQWALATPPFSYNAWLQYTLDIVHHLANEQTDKQLMISLNYVSAYDPSNKNDAYTYANAVAAVAAPSGVAMGVQNLGIKAGSVSVAAGDVAPVACDPTQQYTNIYWCQAYTRHYGVVPLEFQPIVSPIDPGAHDVTIAHLFQYGLDNHAQIFEIYPQDWVFKDDPAQYPAFTAATQADYQAAFAATSLILGRNH